MGKLIAPAVPLTLNIYVHPEAGRLFWGWEGGEDGERRVAVCGCKSVDSWRPVFWNGECTALLAIYVHDLNLAGPCMSLPEVW